MMQQQETKGTDENNATEKKVGSPDPIPIHTPEPDPIPKTDAAASKPVDIPENTTVDIDLNEGNSSISSEEKNGGNKSSPTEGGLKSKKSVRWSQELVSETEIPRSNEHGSGNNPYVNYSASRSNSFNLKETMGGVRDVLGRWGKKAGEAARKAEDLAGNTWQHLKTSPSLTDAALGRIAQGTKVLAEGGYEKIFRQTFETVPEEQLTNSFACYLSTSAGPVMGVLYVSTAKLAFCSDNPLSYQAGDKTEWSYYKVVIPLHQLKAVNPSISRTNSSEKYIQVISVDNHEFWYMGFLNYSGATQCLQGALHVPAESV